MFLLLSGISYSVTDESNRENRIHNFLVKVNPTSPIIGFEKDIVQIADKYGLDYRLYIALSGAESTFGKRYIKNNHNLTGILSGQLKHKSILDNIEYTYKLIATKPYYYKYRATKDVRDLIYVWKGVGPFGPYIETFKWILKKI